MVVGPQRLQLLRVLLEVGLEAVRVGGVQDLLNRVQSLHHHLPVLIRELSEQDGTHHRRVQRLAGVGKASQLVLGGFGTHALGSAQLLHQLPLVASIGHRGARLDHRRRVHGGSRGHGLRSGLATEQTRARGRRGGSGLLGGLSGLGGLRCRSSVATSGLELGLSKRSRGSGLRRLEGLRRRLAVGSKSTLRTVQPVVLGSRGRTRTTSDALHAGLRLGGNRGSRKRVHGTLRVRTVAETLVEEVVNGLLGGGLDSNIHRITLQRIERPSEGEAIPNKLVVSTHFSLEIDTAVYDKILQSQHRENSIR